MVFGGKVGARNFLAMARRGSKLHLALAFLEVASIYGRVLSFVLVVFQSCQDVLAGDNVGK